jgi:lysophospholipase L1-like esterase
MQSAFPRSLFAVLVIGGLLYAGVWRVSAQDAPPSIEPERFEDDIRAFEAEDMASPPPEGAIIITGSSSIRRWHPSMKQDLEPLTVMARGFGGSTMEDALYFIDRIAIAYKPRALVIYEGDNDTGRFMVPPERIVNQFTEIVDRVHAVLPDTRIYVLSVKPSVLRRAYWATAQQTNELLKAVVAKSHLLTYIDVATPFLQSNGEVMTDIFVEDDLHLNDKGTRVWAATIRSALMKGEAHHELDAHNQ